MARESTGKSAVNEHLLSRLPISQAHFHGDAITLAEIRLLNVAPSCFQFSCFDMTVLLDEGKTVDALCECLLAEE